MRARNAGLVAACASLLITLGSSGVAAAQVGSKALQASGSVTGGVTATVHAEVAQDTTAGEGCVRIQGTFRRAAAWEHGCGPLTVEMDDLMTTARVRGTIRTGYGEGFTAHEGWLGSGTVTIDVTLAGTGAPRPGDDVWTTLRCNPIPAWAYCSVPNRYLARSAVAGGTVASSVLRTSGFSGDGTMYVQWSQ